MLGIILIAYLALLGYTLAQIGKRTQATPRMDIKNPTFIYALCSPVIYFCSYFISQSEADTGLFFILNICMTLAFWVFSLSAIFFKFFFDGDNKLFLRDVFVATLVLVGIVPVLIWVKTMVTG